MSIAAPADKARKTPVPRPPKPRSGTQAIERAVAALRVIASRGRRGMRIAEVVSTTGLATSTCFRMLQCLQNEGLAVKDAHTHKYYIGPLVHELGLLARPRYRLSELCQNALDTLALSTRETVYLSERSGLEAVCTASAMGDYPIRALPLDVGIRRPLGVGAGGLAILAALPEEEAEELVRINGSRYEAFGGLTAEHMLQAVAEARERGYAFLDSVATPGTAALGVAIPGATVIAAISVAAISSRLQPQIHEKLVQSIKRQAKKISMVLNELRENDAPKAGWAS